MADASSQAAQAISEKELLQTVLELAETLGWRAYHVFESARYARRTSKGFPDLLLLRNGKLIVAELKSEKGSLTNDQAEWLSEFKECDGVQVFIWTPLSLLIGRIEAVLK